MISVLKPGITRQDVLLRLGEPDYCWEQERLFGYQWTLCTMDVIWFAAANGRAAGGDLKFLEFHELLIEFDAAGRLMRWEQFKNPWIAISEATARPPPGRSIYELRDRWRAKRGE